MSVEDVRLNAKVRRVFAPLWIDIKHISHRTVRGNVQISGLIVRIGADDPDGDPAVMNRLHDSILAIPEIQSVEYNLDNWSFDGSGWKLIGASKVRHRREEEKEKERKELLRTREIDEPGEGAESKEE